MCLAFIGPCLLVYGGRSLPANKPLNDLYALNTITWVWKKLFALEAPPPHDINRMISLSDSKLALISKQIWTFSAADVKWDLTANELPGGVWQKVPVALPFIPSCCSPFSKNCLLLFGASEGNLQAAKVDLNARQLQAIQVVGSHQVGQLIWAGGREDETLLLSNKNLLLCAKVEEGRLEVQEMIRIEKSVEGAVTGEKGIVGFRQGKLIQVEVQWEIQTLNTARQVEEQTHGSCIYQQSNQQSAFMSRQKEQSQESEQKLKLQRLHPGEPYMQGEGIEGRLKQILGQEWLRRRVLEQKGRVLQSAIKGAERLVLALVGYSSEQQKRRHIQRVKNTRIALEGVWQRETYFRRQIQAKESTLSLQDIIQTLPPHPYLSFFTDS